MIRFNAGVDLSGARKRLDAGSKKAQMMLDQQVMKDSNQYIPFDTGNLAGSVARASTLGRIIWDTPYARRLYYGQNFVFSKDSNPLARALWFEAAKAQYLKQWLAMIKEQY